MSSVTPEHAKIAYLQAILRPFAARAVFAPGTPDAAEICITVEAGHLRAAYVACNEPPKRCSAVSYVVRSDDRILCVWNKKYNGWSMPGGKVEYGEHPGDAQHRELKEETGIRTQAAHLRFKASCAFRGPGTEATEVWMYEVTSYIGAEHEAEPGCPVTWLTRDELLKATPFAEFYAKNFGWPWPITEMQPDGNVKKIGHPLAVGGDLTGPSPYLQLEKDQDKAFSARVAKAVGDELERRRVSKEPAWPTMSVSDQALLANEYWVTKELLKRAAMYALDHIEQLSVFEHADSPREVAKRAELRELRWDLLRFMATHRIAEPKKSE
jgi:ADP-ribose pyrophosphatase YjhB (NUDIX family)